MMIPAHCPDCDADRMHAVGRLQVVGRCMTCFAAHHLGMERENAIRTVMEPLHAGPFPRTTAARAMSLSNAIYKTANSGGLARALSLTTLRRRTRSGGGHKADIAFQIPISGRSHGGFEDASHVASVVVMNNPHNPVLPHSIYVVFRGSVGLKNDGGAGRDVGDQSVNVDWRANLNNRHVPHETNGAVRVHRGFQEILGSYEEYVATALRNARAFCRGPNYKVIVTGHSQGAAHAVLFAYNEKLRNPHLPLVCMPFSPPRVGDVNFALDFNAKFFGVPSVLPYDGGYADSAFLMVRGNDPVTFDMKHAINKRDDRRREIADRQYAVKKGLKIQKWERNYFVAEEAFFHPKKLIQIRSYMPIAAMNHKPNWFRSAILNRL